MAPGVAGLPSLLREASREDMPRESSKTLVIDAGGLVYLATYNLPFALPTEDAMKAACRRLDSRIAGAVEFFPQTEKIIVSAFVSRVLAPAPDAAGVAAHLGATVRVMTR
jgi:hypothetical protein